MDDESVVKDGKGISRPAHSARDEKLKVKN